MSDIEKLITEIMMLGYLVNQHTDYCVFINYYGHTDSLDVEIAASKERYSEKVCYTEIRERYINQFKEEENGWLMAKRDTLKEILESGDIDIGSMNEHVENLYTYSF